MSLYDLRKQHRGSTTRPDGVMRSAFRRRLQAVGAEPDTTEQAPLDVYLVGTAFSGTTYLGGLLAANFGALYAGELGRLPKYVEQFGLFADPVGCLTCAAKHRDCEVWTPELIETVEGSTPALAMNRLREASGARVIVDGSKLPAWIQRTLMGRDGADARMAVIITARSPLSYAMSAMGATGQPLYVGLREWRDIYIDAMRTATRTQLPLYVVRNEEVRKDPGTVLDRLAPLFGWPHRVTEVAPAEKTHSIGGNAFVQAGFGADAHAALAKTGLHRDDAVWDPNAFESVAREASVGSLQRPRDLETARSWAQAVVDCPGLLPIAETLGYEMYRELEQLVDGVRAGF